MVIEHKICNIIDNNSINFNRQHRKSKYFRNYYGAKTHVPFKNIELTPVRTDIKWNANLMQQGNFTVLIYS